MLNFFVEISLPNYFTEEFISKIPKQREVVDNWMQKGVILNYSLALDRSKVWMIVSGQSKKEVREVLSTFPLINDMKPEIFPLAFYQGVSAVIPAFSLN